jgi:hypothetical protein
MRPRLWQLLSLALVCGLFAAKAASFRDYSPSRLPGRLPIAGLSALEQDSTIVTADEAEQDSWDIYFAVSCCNSTTGLCLEDFSLLSGESCALGVAPSLVSQGVRLQI